ncbi:hypothetical protein QCM80_37605 [Bradyrhizobium sp. SSUT112]|uniref:hypothetical protein n=1 Tax=Bradyrhizobium sp. SSUT112 TaxID=3040604 RepID=UPI002447DFE6|nr:hypothetical protein [Bradyrhizobium sp. SSUT112]MDH2356333.1 hypothetical protein [Bradyrhizobium sp. SSUT112]
MRKPVPGRVANRAASSDENEASRQARSPVIDARAELLGSSPAERAPPTPPGREVKVADAASVSDGDTQAVMPAAPVTALPSGQLTPEHFVPPQVNVEKLASAARAESPPAMPMGARNEAVRDEARTWTVTWLGVLLMTLGGISILSSSRTLRHAVRLRH